jgi:hypothetical protein
VQDILNMENEPPSTRNISLRSFGNIDTLPEIFQLKTSQVNQYKSHTGESKADEIMLFQMYLRAGMEEYINGSLKTLGLNHKFNFDLNLQSLRNEDRAPNQIYLPRKRISKKKKTIETIENEDVEKGLNKSFESIEKVQDPLKLQTKLSESIVNDILSEIIRNSVSVAEAAKASTMTILPYCNQTMTVNTLQLAILSKQSGAVKSIMNHIFSNKDKDEQSILDTLDVILSEEVDIDYHTNKFTKHEQALQGMNVLHLACQYHPEALHIIFEAITDYEKKGSNDQHICISLKSILQRKNRVMNTTPLHIAVKRCLVDAVR